MLASHRSMIESLESRRLMAAELPVVTLAAPYHAASENGPTIRSFFLTRTGDVSKRLTVNLTAGGTATNGVDYGVVGSTVRFGLGQSSVRVAIRPVDDNIRETLERVTLQVAPGTGYTVGTPESDWIKITDNDGADTRMTVTWSTVAASPQWRSESQKGIIDGKIYVFGGFIEGMDGPKARSDYYDPKTNTWTQIADLPGRFTHAATATDGNKVYMVGGYVGTGPLLGQQDYGTKAVWIYDAGTNTYSSGPELPQPRGAGVMVKLGRELHYMGGCDLQRVDHTDHWVLNLDNIAGGWTASVPLPEPRNHVGAAVFDGHIFYIGGQVGPDDNVGAKDSFYVWHPAWSAWKKLPNLPEPLSHFNEAVVVDRGRIITIGGIPMGGGSTRDVSSYDPKTGQWTAMTPLPVGRFSGLGAILDDTIYYLVGTTSVCYKGVFTQPAPG